LNVAAGRTRSSIAMVGAPPVVMLMTQDERCFTTLRNGRNASGAWSGWPVSGLRACRCTIAAPASAAPIAASAISSAVIGRCGDMDGVWMAPVTAQVMMTLSETAIGFAPYVPIDLSAARLCARSAISRRSRQACRFTRSVRGSRSLRSRSTTGRTSPAQSTRRCICGKMPE
jgi:hypothetical protein